jgi:hypothetical protein
VQGLQPSNQADERSSGLTALKPRIIAAKFLLLVMEEVVRPKRSLRYYNDIVLACSQVR